MHYIPRIILESNSARGCGYKLQTGSCVLFMSSLNTNCLITYLSQAFSFYGVFNSISK
jgi:hypothetical protein